RSSWSTATPGAPARKPTTHSSPTSTAGTTHTASRKTSAGCPRTSTRQPGTPNTTANPSRLSFNPSQPAPDNPPSEKPGEPQGNGWHDHEAGATHTIQSWITSWTEFLSTTAPMIFLVAVIVYGSWRIIMRGGGWPWKTMVFVLGAA